MPNPFASDEMARGYAMARPPVHEKVLQLVHNHLKQPAPFQRALDVGCGAGLSTRALAKFARERIGLEPAEAMTRLGPGTAPGAHFLTGTAEALPLRNLSVDLMTAAGSLNYANLDLFFPEAARVLRPDGLLVVYDFGPGRRFRDSQLLENWYASFAFRFPSPPKEATQLNPEILNRLSPGFVVVRSEHFEIGLTLKPEFYLDYILTETNVAFATRNGVPLEEVKSWCAQSLRSVWAGKEQEVLFEGYFACMRVKWMGSGA